MLLSDHIKQDVSSQHEVTETQVLAKSSATLGRTNWEPKSAARLAVLLAETQTGLTRIADANNLTTPL